jgi:hypothetical protein
MEIKFRVQSAECRGERGEHNRAEAKGEKRFRIED